MNTTTNNIPISGISQSEEESNLEGGDGDPSKSTDNLSNRLTLTPISQRILLNVFHTIAKTYHQSIAVKKTSDLTNVDTVIIYKLIKKGIQTKKPRLLPVSPKIATLIENAIQQLQSSRKSLSIKTIAKLVKLKSPEINSNPSKIRIWMKNLGYKYALIPPKFTSRQEVRDFLAKHNLPFEETYSKKELLAVVAKYKCKSKSYILYKSEPNNTIKNVQ